ncbi:MAG TPA: porin [Usitatibacter sp.]|nr:porin [Usitatibacter sp.]
MTIRPSLCLAALAALCVASGSAAQEGPRLTISGYGTAGIVHSSEEHADYVIDQFKPNGPGATRRWSADVDSRIGLQLTAELVPRVTAVAQVVSQQRYDNSYEPVLEWANVKWQATPDLSVRAGRIVLPIFMVTDSRKIGYSNPWVRPPVEVYYMVPITSTDGVDASWRRTFGGVTHTLQATLGRADAKFPPQPSIGSGVAKVRDILAAVYTYERGFFTGRVNYGQAKLTIEQYDPLFAGFRQFGPPGAAIADRYDLHGRKADFVGVGISYDAGAWFAVGEWAHFDTHSIVGAKQAWYASGGYRVGTVTPYATYARIQPDGSTSDPGLPLAGLPPQLAAAGAQLNALLNAQLSVVPRQATWSAGIRWDFLRNAAIKLQWDRVRRADGSVGTFANLQPGFGPGGTANLVSAAVDFVF